MNFVWNMNEKNWQNLKKDHTNRLSMNMSKDFDFYGDCCIGNLCAEILHTGDDSDKSSWYAFTNIYALGIDDGYGETLEGNIPYALLHGSFKVPINCKTFDGFKRVFEKRFEEFINSNEQYKELANMPLGNWN